MRVYKFSMHSQNPVLRDPWKLNDYAYLRSSCLNWHDWHAPCIERDPDDEFNHEELQDFSVIQLGSAFPLVSERARRTIQTVCDIQEQWLPTWCTEKAYTVLNSRNVIDALDEEKSSLTRYNDSAKIKSVSAYAFRPEVIEHEWIFRTLSYPSDLFYTDRFAELCDHKKWTGLWLEPVWDSAVEPFSDRPTRKDILARPEVYGPDGIVKGLEHAWPREWNNQVTRPSQSAAN